MNPSLEYIAGILDSRGRFWLSRDRREQPRWACLFTYNSYRKEVADFLKKMFGGSVAWQKGKDQESRLNKTWRWDIKGKELESFCTQMLPIFIFLKQECELIMKFRETFLNSTPPRPLPPSVIEYRDQLCREFDGIRIKRVRK